MHAYSVSEGISELCAKEDEGILEPSHRETCQNYCREGDSARNIEDVKIRGAEYSTNETAKQ